MLKEAGTGELVGQLGDLCIGFLDFCDNRKTGSRNVPQVSRGRENAN